MSILEFLVLLLIAAVIGAIGQALAGFYIGGCLLSAGVGFVGALLGAVLARTLGLPELLVMTIGDQPFPIVWSIIGSVIFVAVVGLLTRGRRITVVRRD